MAIKKEHVHKTYRSLGIGGAIVKYREELVGTQADLVEKLREQGYDCKRSMVTTVETGDNEPSLAMLQALEKVFDMESESLTPWWAMLSILRIVQRASRGGGGEDIPMADYIGLLELGHAEKKIREEWGEDKIRRLEAELGAVELNNYLHMLAERRKTPREEIQPRVDAFLRAIPRTKEVKQERQGKKRKRR